ncbi:MAG: hypothetical protein EBQ56_08310 [Proteobacteria bacterium]|nr:hypothetical protein [Pseudomonadota bacterium]NDE06232.1 hypothetical protein [Chloroflexota bacterium]NDF54358.1 hypothetical protein [Pseudomonadota bacterium]NDF95923.1 hypothetical protein [Pseudomonadota bacterium]
MTSSPITTTTNSSGSSTNPMFSFGGLASGLDTNAIVSQLMSIEKRPLVKMQNQQATLQNRKSLLTEISTKLSSLRSATSTLMLSTATQVRTATSTNTAVATATAGANTSLQSFTIKTSQLATRSSLTSGGVIGAAVSDATTISDIPGANLTSGSGTITIGVRDTTTGVVTSKTLTINATDTVGGVRQAIQDTLNNDLISGGGVSSSITLGKFSFVAPSSSNVIFGSPNDSSNFFTITNLATAGTSTTALGTSTLAKAGVSSNATGFTISDGTHTTTVSVNSSSTMDDVVNSINSQLGAATGSGGLGLTGVTASFANGKFTISGHTGTLTIGNLTGSTSAETLANRGLVTALNLPTTATSTPLSSSSTISINEQTITSDAGVTEFSSSATLGSGSTGGLGLTGAGEIRVNGTLITYDTATDTLSTVISRINSSGANVLASYDSLTGKVTMQNKSTGASVVTVDDNNGNDNAGLISALKLDSSSSAVTTLGQNAIYSINGGASKSSTSNTITNAISGATITLAGTLDTTATITIAQDSTTALTNVKAFVTAYNDAMTWVIENTKVDAATKTRGVFAGDSAITAMQSKLRAAINSAASSISTTYKTLPSIGLSSGAVGSTVGTTNTLVLDESKFAAALAADSSAVSSLFGSSGGPLDTLKTYLVAATSFSGLIYSSQTSADTQLRDLDKRISTMQQRLDDKQASLQKKYSDLEAAMSKLQAQSSSLSSQLAGLNKSG